MIYSNPVFFIFQSYLLVLIKLHLLSFHHLNFGQQVLVPWSNGVQLQALRVQKFRRTWLYIFAHVAKSNEFCGLLTCTSICNSGFL